MINNYNINVTRLKGTDLGCFKGEQGFDFIKPLNIIIGKNNSGKSTLLDLVQGAISSNHASSLSGFQGRLPGIAVSCLMDDVFLSAYCPKTGLSGSWTTDDYARRFFLGREITVPVYGGSVDAYLVKTAENFNHSQGGVAQFAAQTLRVISNKLGSPLSRLQFRRIVADRDIWPEIADTPSDPLPDLLTNGGNATKLITRYLSQEDLDRSIVESKITNELNKIFHPDAEFLRILPRQKRNNVWEIYLDEPNKGLVPMSRTGSGIKTVLLVLLNLYLAP
jgi:hypothetical protein